MTTGDKFRWRFYDEDLGDTWSEWHVVEGACKACCCDGPDQGEHQEQCIVYDESDDYLPNFQAHTRLDPHDIPPWRIVEWSS